MKTVLADLGNADLVSHVRQLLASGAKLEVETLIALNVMHERKLYEPAGFGSFHVYCVNVLRTSDDTAARRSKVGRLLRVYPVLVRELIVVREVPKPPVQSGFRTVFAPALTLNAEQATKGVDSNAVRDEKEPGVMLEEKIRINAVSAPANVAPPRCKKKPIEPRAVDHYAFSANMNEATKVHLKEAMDVGNFESYDALFAAAVEALRTELLKKKYAQVSRPRKKSPATQMKEPRVVAPKRALSISTTASPSQPAAYQQRRTSPSTATLTTSTKPCSISARLIWGNS